jgi:hypothetical protein
MTEDQWQRVDDLLQSAIDREPSQRASFLDQACAGDHALRQQVEALLRGSPGERFPGAPSNRSGDLHHRL